MRTLSKFNMAFFVVVGLLMVIPAILASGPTVTVREGTLVGKTVRFNESEFINVDKDIDLFLGVPYADPPRRFKPPTAKQPWTEPLNVTEFKPACTQDPSRLPRGEPIDEDCLYLNVYTPSPKPTNASVMVWIHGGAFVAGTAMTYLWYGVPLVAVGDVIVVAINYRLGVFAKFTTKDAEAPGNIGMLDQVAALQWVYDNIEAFGGNKDQITLWGESAGAASVEFHTLSKLSRGLFNQIITQSGTTIPFWAFDTRTPEAEVQNAHYLGLTLGCDTSSSSTLTACLENKTADEILSAGAPFYSLAPVSLDGYFLDDTPTNLYYKGDFKRCPMLTGVNEDDATTYLPLLPPSGYNELGRPLYPQANLTVVEEFIRTGLLIAGITDEILIDAVFQEYIDWAVADDPSADMIRPFLEFSGDSGYACPLDLVTRFHVGVGDTVFKYFMTHAPSRSTFQGFQGEQWYGSGHGEELTFVFGMPFIEQLQDIGGAHLLTDEEKELSVKIMTFWTNYVKFGDPSKSSADAEPGEGQYYWPPFTVPGLYYKEISLALEVGRALKARQCHFWNDFFPKLQEYVGSRDDVLGEWQYEFQKWQTNLADWQTAFNKYQDSATCP